MTEFTVPRRVFRAAWTVLSVTLFCKALYGSVTSSLRLIVRPAPQVRVPAARRYSTKQAAIPSRHPARRPVPDAPPEGGQIPHLRLVGTHHQRVGTGGCGSSHDLTDPCSAFLNRSRFHGDLDQRLAAMPGQSAACPETEVVNGASILGGFASTAMPLGGDGGPESSLAGS